MKLNSRADVDAPAEFVFGQLADFDGWERAALRRGADVVRADTLTNPGAGMFWTVGFSWRGKRRQVALTLVSFDPPERLGFSGTGSNLDGTLSVDLVDMTQGRTRITVHLEVKPRTLVARLFLQSLRLPRARVDARLRERVAQVAAEIEDRFRRSRTA